MADTVPIPGQPMLATLERIHAELREAFAPPVARAKLENGDLWIFDQGEKRYVATVFNNGALVPLEGSS